MAILEFRSTDPGAPVLNNALACLIALLDACLVNGYGSKASAGWAKAFTGTNLAAYRAPAGNRFYLRVDDTGAVGNAATTSARVIGYETMSDVSTGTNLFPTAAQTGGGFHFPKTLTASATTARPWRLYADDRRFYLIVEPNSAASELGSQTITDGRMRAQFFGDFISLATSDPTSTILLADSSNGTGSGIVSSFGQANGAISTTRARVARNFAGTLSDAVTVSSAAHVTDSGTSTEGGLYPGACTDELNLYPIWIRDTGSLRGRMPGLFALDQALPEASCEEFTQGGITYLLVDNAGVGSRCALQISGSWT